MDENGTVNRDVLRRLKGIFMRIEPQLAQFIVLNSILRLSFYFVLIFLVCYLLLDIDFTSLELYALLAICTVASIIDSFYQVFFRTFSLELVEGGGNFILIRNGLEVSGTGGLRVLSVFGKRLPIKFYFTPSAESSEIVDFKAVSLSLLAYSCNNVALIKKHCELR